jgi:putative molybdopterin biosynthesis protein
VAEPARLPVLAGDGAAPPAGAVRGRLAPDVAYATWIDACAVAGWKGRTQPDSRPLADCLGRVTASPVVADRPSPWFDCAAMDGIAVQADAVALQDTHGNASRSSRWRLAPAHFVWVDTGEPMPPGTDTVVEAERVQIGADGSAWITGPAPSGMHVRAVGEDFAAGQLLIPSGHRIRPVDLAAAAAAGHAELAVVRRPVVAIIPTGTEIRPAGAALRTGEVTDSNSPMLAGQATEAGATPVIGPVQPDDPAVIAAAVTQAAQTADLVLLIAGSSNGHRDHGPAVLSATGGLAVRGVAVRPGHPALLGYAFPGPPDDRRAADPVPVIGIPGYPLAAVVTFELFAVPLLAALQGCKPPDRPRLRVQLTCDWTSPPDIEDWVPVSLAPMPAGASLAAAALATPGRRGAGAISRLVRADAWWPIPVGQAQFSVGEQVEVQPIPGVPAGLGSLADAPA